MDLNSGSYSHLNKAALFLDVFCSESNIPSFRDMLYQIEKDVNEVIDLLEETESEFNLNATENKRDDPLDNTTDEDMYSGGGTILPT